MHQTHCNPQPARSFLHVLYIIFIVATISGCRKEESVERIIDSKYALSERDFFLKGLFYRADSKAVVIAIGFPDSIRDLKQSDRFNCAGFSYWYYPDYQLIFNPTKKLDAIEVKHSGFLTAKGLGVGDSLRRVRELYGCASNDVDLPHAILYYCYNRNDTTGIAVRISDNMVKSIYVGRFH